MLHFVAAVAFCVRVREGWGEAGANMNIVKRIVSLNWNQTYIYI